MGRLIGMMFFLVSLSGCQSGSPGSSVNLTVHFVDPTHIVRQAEYRGHPQPQFVEGIFDPTSNTIWCPAGEDLHSLAICGHELRHAIMGPWHEDYWSPLSTVKR